MQQLKYAGGMRLIRKRKVADAIAGYDALLRNYETDMQELQGVFSKVDDKLGQIIKLSGLDMAQSSIPIEELESAKESYLLRTDAPPWRHHNPYYSL